MRSKRWRIEAAKAINSVHLRKYFVLCTKPKKVPGSLVARRSLGVLVPEALVGFIPCFTSFDFLLLLLVLIRPTVSPFGSRQSPSSWVFCFFIGFLLNYITQLDLHSA